MQWLSGTNYDVLMILTPSYKQTTGSREGRSPLTEILLQQEIINLPAAVLPHKAGVFRSTRQPDRQRDATLSTSPHYQFISNSQVMVLPSAEKEKYDLLGLSHPVFSMIWQVQGKRKWNKPPPPHSWVLYRSETKLSVMTHNWISPCCRARKVNIKVAANTDFPK